MWTEFGRKRFLGLEDWEGKEAPLSHVLPTHAGYYFNESE